MDYGVHRFVCFIFFFATCNFKTDLLKVALSFKKKKNRKNVDILKNLPKIHLTLNNILLKSVTT